LAILVLLSCYYYYILFTPSPNKSSMDEEPNVKACAKLFMTLSKYFLSWACNNMAREKEAI